RVVVVQSNDPDFFIAHADVELILQLPVPEPGAPPSAAPNPFHAMVERFRTMPKATIGVIEGYCRGGGSEFALSLDMRFAALGKAVLSQPEVALGILPGGSGTQRLPRLCGRSRALEIVLGCEDFPADLAERYGWVNRALPPEELRPFVRSLAERIASFPADAIARTKAALIAGEPEWGAGLAVESNQFDQCLTNPEARRRMEEFMANGGQTREAEARDLSPLLSR
ncbi:MAG: enoyl-CoA hydratase/isomerase family protein, partial [Myxococcales bacterium]|nr:enoyl-CoA hydratase/isomerase family protein [Myxococcales bacterium]